jgi:hypothetical protein
MARSISLISKIVAFRPEPFETPVSWYSNGERGHLHHSRYCEKVAKSKTDTVTRTLLTRDALTRTLCPECLGMGEWTGAQRDVITAGSALERLEQQLSGPTRSPLEGVGTDAIESMRRRTYFLRMQAVLAELEASDHLTEWREQLCAQAKQLTPEEPPFEDVENAVLRYVSVATFWKRLSKDDSSNPFWGSRSVTSVLGHPSWSDWNNPRTAYASIAMLGSAWTQHVKAGLTPAQASARLLDPSYDLSQHLAEPDWKLLNACTDLEAPAAGENLAVYAKRVWKERARRATTELFSMWEERIAKLIEPTENVVTAYEGYGPDEVAGMLCGTDVSMLIAALQRTVAVRSSRNGKIAVLCHPTISDYLSSTYGRSGWSSAQPLPEENTHETIETALALWDSWDRDGSYNTFEKALEAARRI